MTQIETLEKPKAYETAPSSRSQAVGDSLAYLGNKFTESLGRAKMAYENGLFNLEQDKPRAGKVARVAIPLAAYLLIPAVRAATTYTFDQMDTRLFEDTSGVLNFPGDPHDWTILYDLDAGNETSGYTGELVYQIPVELKDNAAIHVFNETGAQIADVHPKGVDYLGAILGINDSKGNIVDTKILGELPRSPEIWWADTAHKEDQVRKALAVTDYLGLTEKSGPAEANIYLGENGAFKKVTLIGPAQEFDANIGWVDKGENAEIHRSFFERASDVVRDLKNGQYKRMIDELTA